MPKVILRKSNRIKRKLKISHTVLGTSKKPRVSIFRSNKYIYAQFIDDEKGKTILSTASEVAKIHKGKKKVDAAFEVGLELAKKASEIKIKKVVFDRNGYKYHGRVRKLAEGLREGGLTL